MKTNVKLCLAMAAVAAAVWAQPASERVTLSQVPEPVRKTIETSKADGPVKEIIRRIREDGKVIYQVEIEKNNAPNPQLRIAEDGSLVRDDVPIVGPEGVWAVAPEYAGLNAMYRSTLKLEDLPAPVQKTVKAESLGREIADIDQEKWGDQTVYEVEFRQSGRNPQIHVAEDGGLLRDGRKRQGSLKSLFLGTQLEDTPAAVQESIRRIAGDREIADIDKRGPLGRPAYRVTIRSGNTTEIVHIGEDGQLLRDSRQGTPAPNRP